MADDLISDLDVVLHDDPALDLERMDLRRYLETRDPSLIREKPGQRARRFTLRALDVNEAAGVSAVPVAAMPSVAVRHALVKINPGLDGETVWEPKAEVQDELSGGLRRQLSARELNMLFGSGARSLGRARLSELGLVVIDRVEKGASVFPGGGATGDGALFTVPLSSSRVLDQSDRLRAELRRTESETKT